MSKSVATKHSGRRPAEDFDQTAICALDALPKPLKLTATQKRRALKKRAGKVDDPAREHGR
jgi:hypothetical protein